MNEERFNRLVSLEGDLIRALSAINFYRLRILRFDAEQDPARYLRAWELSQEFFGLRSKRLARFSENQLNNRQRKLSKICRNITVDWPKELLDELHEINFELSFRRLLHI